MTVVDVAECIAALNIVDRQHVYCGKMQDKKEQCIGVYNLTRQQDKRNTVGGIENSSYAIKPISILVHWNKSIGDTEKAAEKLYRAIENIRNVTVNEVRILFTRLLTDVPIDVGTDDDGIYEMVIEANIYYER